MSIIFANRLALVALLFSIFLPQARAADPACPGTVVRANVAAIEQVIVWNRFGSFNPSGMMYALERDLTSTDKAAPETLKAGSVRLRDGKRPRPLVLRVNEGDCLEVQFRNLLTPAPPGPEEQIQRTVPAHILQPPSVPASTKLVNGRFSNDFIATRAASMHVGGLQYMDIKADGANVGNNPSSLVMPGDTIKYRWLASKEGTYFLHSMGAPVGGEGDGGQIGQGLFGAVIVEPRNSRWFRSQVTSEELTKAAPGGDYTKIDYEKLSMLQGDEIIHSDLNAIIAVWRDFKPGDQPCKDMPSGSSCYRNFREFTVIFHDEIKAVQAFQELDDEDNPLSAIRDNMAINYGSSGLGAMYLANRRGIGPAKDCPECLAEEFFLTSWANGDPAMVINRDKDGKATGVSYPDDPSNVHHSYLGDPVWFRNIHAGPKETHVFHLHAHQWLMDRGDPNSTYLDSQTVSPGSAFTYEIWYGGSGNRNLTVGDSIFHCHLYPHFAEGMWELWRVHDVFENGKRASFTKDDPSGRNLPDAEIQGGTATPAIVPIPYLPLAPRPSKEMPGYPFYIPGVPGHRPPQPPMDFSRDGNGGFVDGGLPRHVVLAGLRTKPGDPAVQEQLFKKGGPTSELIARRVAALNRAPELTGDMTEWEWLKLKELPADGTPEEKRAMQFHAGRANLWPVNLGWNTNPAPRPTQHQWPATGYRTANAEQPSVDVNPLPPFHNQPWKRHPGDQRRFLVNGTGSKPGAPFANPCPVNAPVRTYKGAFIQFGMTVNKEGWHDPQARITVLEQDIKPVMKGEKLAEPFFIRARSEECIEYQVTNLIPNALNLDDFQIFTPTDTIGQHIHLVKFDVTSADGSANGWNYEDSTFSADEVRERVHAFNKGLRKFPQPGAVPLSLKEHPMFRTGGALAGDERGRCVIEVGGHVDPAKHPWCGAQSTVQRWWADPMLAKGPAGNWDRTIRTVFTHDHMGASSHQQHGMYSALVIEPKNAVWTHLDGSNMLRPNGLGLRADGGPTSFAANVTVGRDHNREFLLALADFSIVYNQKLEPVNPPVKDESAIFLGHRAQAYLRPRPEAISTEDPGTQLLNYRNEPIPLRIASESRRGEWSQRKDIRGDLANVFSSWAHREVDDEYERPRQVRPPAYLTGMNLLPPARVQSVFDRLERNRQRFLANLRTQEPWRLPGDPATPVLPVYEGDRVQVRLIQGSQEEQHTFMMNGVRWRHQASAGDGRTASGRRRSGYVGSQAVGISEHFEFDMNILPSRGMPRADHFYASTSSENLWDGQWGILRAFSMCSGFRNRQFMQSYPLLRDATCEWAGYTTGNLVALGRPAAAPVVLPDKLQFINSQEEMKKNPPARGSALNSACPDSPTKPTKVQVAVVRVCELLGNCGKAGGGLVYNAKYGLSDPNAIIYVDVPDSVMSGPLDRSARVKKIANDVFTTRPIEPMVLRTTAGSCLSVRLHNLLPREDQTPAVSYNYVPPIVDGFNFNQVHMSRAVGLHAPLVTTSVFASDGMRAGYNGVLRADGEVFLGDTRPLPTNANKPVPLLAEPDGGTVELNWYAGRLVANPDPQSELGPYVGVPVEFGAVPLMSLADPVKHGSHSLAGVLIVEPAGAEFSYPSSSRLTAQITPKQGKPFNEFAVLIQDDLSLQVTAERPGAPSLPLANLRGGEDAEDSGAKAINYHTEPLWARVGWGTPAVEFEDTREGNYCAVLSSAPEPVTNEACKKGLAKGPASFEAPAGSEVRLRVVHAGGHQRQHTFALSGHQWQMLPVTPEHDGRPEDAPTMDSTNQTSYPIGAHGGLGPGAAINIAVRAGGACGVPGDYLFRSQPSFLFDGGAWGILRVSGASAVPNNDCQKKK